MTSIKKLSAFALTLFLTASVAGAADIFVDDFSDEGASIRNWMSSNTDQFTAVVSESAKTLTLTNSHSEHYREYYHTFTNKPSTFTVSYVMKSSTPQYGQYAPGLFFCRTSALNGYQIVRYSTDNVVVFKTVGGDGSSIFTGRSVDWKPADNKFTVSKRGSDFHIFVNDVFIGKFTDTQYASGDVSFFMPKSSSAVFADFRMTDQFTDGEPTSFFDDFESGNLKYWQTDGNGSGTSSVTPEGGKMKMKTEADAWVWAQIDMDLTEFVASVKVRHVGGSGGAPYGLFLIGPENSTDQMVTFAIMGGRQASAWIGGTVGEFLDAGNLWGNAGGTTRADTLEIRRNVGANAYEFWANGERIANVNLPVASFPIAGIGVIAYPGLEIEVDDFYVERLSAPSSIKDRPAISHKPPVAKNQNKVFYDLKGRKRYSASNTAVGRLPGRGSMAAGVYVNENGRDVRVRKDRR